MNNSLLRGQIRDQEREEKAFNCWLFSTTLLFNVGPNSFDVPLLCLWGWVPTYKISNQMEDGDDVMMMMMIWFWVAGRKWNGYNKKIPSWGGPNGAKQRPTMKCSLRYVGTGSEWTGKKIQGTACETRMTQEEAAMKKHKLLLILNLPLRRRWIFWECSFWPTTDIS